MLTDAMAQHVSHASTHRRVPIAFRWVAVALGASLGAAGCTGSVGTDRDGAGDNGVNSVTTQSLTCQGQFTLASETPMVRLTQEQYRNTIASLFANVSITATLPPDSELGPFHINTQSPLSDTFVRYYQTAAEHIASSVMQSTATLLGGCNRASQGDDACFEQFLTTFGRRAFRRPLTDAERSLFTQQIYQPLQSEMGFDLALRTVLEAMLQSVPFLYRFEMGNAAPELGEGMYRLTDYEIASRMSYLIWQSAPDDTLLDLAESGTLSSDAVRGEQVTRMLADERAKKLVHTFHRDLYRLHRMPNGSKDATMYPSFNDSMRASMRTSTELFLDEAVWRGDSLNDVLSARYVYVDAPLAQLYGVPAPAGGGFERRELSDASERSGILTHPSFLTSHADMREGSVVQRGLTVRKHLLCENLPPPPPTISMDPTIPRLEDPTCKGCHVLMDTIGEGLARYNAIGAEITSNPPSGEGEILGLADGAFQGGRALSERLAGEAAVRSCMAKQWFRFAQAREPSTSDSCATTKLEEILASTDGSLRGVVAAIVTSPTFVVRQQGNMPATCN
jgi:hypothetical protein